MTPEVVYLLIGAGLATVLILVGQWVAAASRRRDAIARRADLAARRERFAGAGMTRATPDPDDPTGSLRRHGIDPPGP